MDSELRELVEDALMRSTSGNGEWRRANCPICDIRMGVTDAKKSLSYNTNTGYFKCFRCEVRGHLYGELLFDPSPKKEIENEKVDIQLPENYMPLVGAMTAMVTEPARKYLLSRNVAEQTWKDTNIGVVLEGKYNGRVIVPIYKEQKIHGWVGRLWVKNKNLLPHQYPPGMKRGDLLWNSEALQVETDEPAILVEGVFDALPHYPYAVAALGKPSLNGDQYQMLLKAKRPLVIALDGDAWREAEMTAMLLQLEGIKSTHIKLPPATDPGDMLPGELLRQAKEAIGSTFDTN